MSQVCTLALDISSSLQEVMVEQIFNLCIYFLIGMEIFILFKLALDLTSFA